MRQKRCPLGGMSANRKNHAGERSHEFHYLYRRFGCGRLGGPLIVWSPLAGCGHGRYLCSSSRPLRSSGLPEEIRAQRYTGVLVPSCLWHEASRVDDGANWRLRLCAAAFMARAFAPTIEIASRGHCMCVVLMFGSSCQAVLLNYRAVHRHDGQAGMVPIPARSLGNARSNHAMAFTMARGGNDYVIVNNTLCSDHGRHGASAGVWA
jgi:hypothetical protein